MSAPIFEIWQFLDAFAIAASEYLWQRERASRKKKHYSAGLWLFWNIKT